MAAGSSPTRRGRSARSRRRRCDSWRSRSRRASRARPNGSGWRPCRHRGESAAGSCRRWFALSQRRGGDGGPMIRSFHAHGARVQPRDFSNSATVLRTPGSPPACDCSNFAAVLRRLPARVQLILCGLGSLRTRLPDRTELILADQAGPAERTAGAGRMRYWVSCVMHRLRGSHASGARGPVRLSASPAIATSRR
jgi:hypothetical protein